jgi:hypothetical protein
VTVPWKLQEDQPILMTMTLGRSYGVSEVQGYLKTLSEFSRFSLIAYLDQSGGFIGCSSRSGLAGLVENDALGEAFLSAIRQGDVDRVFRFPGMLRRVGPPSATNAEALAAMTANNFDHARR